MSASTSGTRGFAGAISDISDRSFAVASATPRIVALLGAIFIGYECSLGRTARIADDNTAAFHRNRGVGA